MKMWRMWRKLWCQLFHRRHYQCFDALAASKIPFGVFYHDPSGTDIPLHGEEEMYGPLCWWCPRCPKGRFWITPNPEDRGDWHLGAVSPEAPDLPPNWISDGTFTLEDDEE